MTGQLGAHPQPAHPSSQPLFPLPPRGKLSAGALVLARRWDEPCRSAASCCLMLVIAKAFCQRTKDCTNMMLLSAAASYHRTSGHRHPCTHKPALEAASKHAETSCHSAKGTGFSAPASLPETASEHAGASCYCASGHRLLFVICVHNATGRQNQQMYGGRTCQ